MNNLDNKKIQENKIEADAAFVKENKGNVTENKKDKVIKIGIRIVILLLIILIIILAFHKCNGNKKAGEPKTSKTTTSQEGTGTATEAPTEKIDIKPNSDEQPTTAPANFNSNLQMIIPGYNGQKRQLAPGESFSFANSVHNEVLLQYTVLYEGHEIWKSPKLDPGTKALFVASEVLPEAGAYDLGLVCKGFTPNGEECNSINQTITIILTK